MIPFLTEEDHDEWVRRSVESERRKKARAEYEAKVYAEAAQAKLKRDARSFAEYRKTDQAEWEKTRREITAKRLKQAEEDFANWRAEADARQAECGIAEASYLTAEKAAADARDYAKKLQDAYDASVEVVTIKTGLRSEMPVEVPPEDAAKMLRDAADAREVAARRAETHRKLEADYNEADAALMKVRKGLTAACAALREAREAAEGPFGEAPFSNATIAACASYMESELWETLSAETRMAVRRAIAPKKDVAPLNPAVLLGRP